MKYALVEFESVSPPYSMECGKVVYVNPLHVTKLESADKGTTLITMGATWSRVTENIHMVRMKLENATR